MQCYAPFLGDAIQNEMHWNACKGNLLSLNGQSFVKDPCHGCDSCMNISVTFLPLPVCTLIKKDIVPSWDNYYLKLFLKVCILGRLKFYVLYSITVIIISKILTTSVVFVLADPWISQFHFDYKGFFSKQSYILITISFLIPFIFSVT